MKHASTTFIALSFAAVTIAASPVRAEDTLSAARDLYASAAYEDALAALNRLRSTAGASADVLTIDQYRAFCLLALGKTTEAQAAIEAIVVADPLYRPSGDEVSPRVRSAFSDVRRRLLPNIVQRQYADAKTAFENKDFVAADVGFRRVLSALADPDMGPSATQPPLSDLRVLAGGFQELSAKAAAPPQAPVAQPVMPPVAQAPLPPAPKPAAPPRIYTTADESVVAPVVIRQVLPPFVGRAPVANGVIEVTIDERGQVEAAAIRASINPSYDHQALNAARSWRYQPAMLNGMPVKFKKMIQISVIPQQ